MNAMTMQEQKINKDDQPYLKGKLQNIRAEEQIKKAIEKKYRSPSAI